MSGRSRRQGLDHTVLTVSVSTLRQRLEIECPDLKSHEALKFIDATPSIDGFSAKPKPVQLQEVQGYYRLPLTDNYASEGDLSHILSDLHTWHFIQSRLEFPQSPLLHAGSLAVGGKMMLIFGDKGAGKSTLMGWLGHAGLEVCGDEHVLLNGLHGITRPRTLRLKQGSLKLMPAKLRSAIEQSPFIEDWHSRKIYAVSPQVFGRPWKIRSLPISAIIVLKPNHGGFSSIKAMGEEAITQRILDNTLLPENDRFAGIIAVRHLLSSVPLYELNCGALDRVSSIVYKLLNRLGLSENDHVQ